MGGNKAHGNIFTHISWFISFHNIRRRYIITFYCTCYLRNTRNSCCLFGCYRLHQEGIKEGAMQSFITILKLNLENGFRTILISKFKNIRIAWHQLITRYFF